MVWTDESFEDKFDKLENDQNNIISPYDSYVGRYILKAAQAVDVRDKTVAVFGSGSPWIEAILLYAGAKQIVTVEY